MDAADPVDGVGERAVGAPPARARSRAAHWLLLAGGWVFAALAVAGAVLPLLPTTPFLLLAAACWARSSERLHRALLAHRLLGPYLVQWREERTVPARAKVTAIALVVLTLSCSAAVSVRSDGGRVALGLAGVALVVFLARLPTRRVSR